MTHPVRCWLFDGHERCAIRAAADHAENRAVWLRHNIDNPTPEAVAVALQQLNGRPEPIPPPTQLKPGKRTLTDQQILEIRDLYGVNGGNVGLVTMRQLASYYGVSYTLIHRIVHAEQVAA